MNRVVLSSLGILALTSTAALAESREYELAPFQSIRVSAGIAANVTVGGAQKVTAEAPNSATLNRLEVTVRDGQLRIGIEWNLLDFLFNMGQRRPITMEISAPSLVAAEASSGADVDVVAMSGSAVSLDASSGASLMASAIKAGEIRLAASSGAHLEIEGTCDRMFGDASSGANLKAIKLTCDAIDVDASSGGHVEAFARTTADAEASSGGGITILGNPAHVNRETSSGGSIAVGQ